MPDPTRYEHELNIEDGIEAKTTRFERMYAEDLSGLDRAFELGFKLEARFSKEEDLIVSLTRAFQKRKVWGRFSGLTPAVFLLSEAFAAGVEGELPPGPTVTEPTEVEGYLLSGGALLMTKYLSLYQVHLRLKIPSVRRRVGAKVVTYDRFDVRQGSAKNPFEAMTAAMQGSTELEEIICV